MFAALGQRHVADAKELIGDLPGAIEAEQAKWLFFGGATDLRPADGRAIDAAETAALFCTEAGLWGEAEEWIARSRSLRQSDRGRKAVEARLAAHRGDHAEALRLAREALEYSKRSDRLNVRARRWRILAEVQLSAGQTDEADASLARAIELYELKGNVAAAARARSSLVIA
jgi:tetratricopeptide (TPR) repeat protein